MKTTAARTQELAKPVEKDTKVCRGLGSVGNCCGRSRSSPPGETGFRSLHGNIGRGGREKNGGRGIRLEEENAVDTQEFL